MAKSKRGEKVHVGARHARKAKRAAVKAHKHAHHHVSVIRVKQAKQILIFSVAIFIMGAAMLTYALIENSDGSRARVGAENVVIESAGEQYSTLSSSLGFSLKYNTVFDSGKAVSGNGKTKYAQPKAVDSKVVWPEKDYATVTVQPVEDRDAEEEALKTKSLDSSMMKVNVVNAAELAALKAANPSKDPLVSVIEQYAPQSLTEAPIQSTVQLESINDVTVNNYKYKEAVFSQDVTFSGLMNNKLSYQQKQYLYVTEQNSSVYVVAFLDLRVGVSDESYERYKTYLDSMEYKKPTAVASAEAGSTAVLGITSDAAEEAGRAFSATKFASMFEGDAYAQGGVDATDTTVALYEPATVRIINYTCFAGTMTYVASVQLPSICSGSVGTGFIVSEDGYVGTNGHVASSTPQELLSQMVEYGEPKVITAAITALNGSDAEAGAYISNESARQFLADYLRYFGDDYKLNVTQQKTHYAVELGDGVAKLNESAQDLFNDDLIAYTDDVVGAEFVDMDYNQEDPLSAWANPNVPPKESELKWTASDVALLKLDTDYKFPVVKLGSIDALATGSQILVIGYPGVAENSALVSKESSTPTATKGIVSAIKDAVGTTNKLIQTDATIDHGNSGGPAFNDHSEVVGLATYGSVNSTGEFNYLRDIQDLKNVLDENGAAYNKGSEVQKIWEKGLENYNKRYFTDAIKDFNKVLALYPPHSQAQTFIARANERKANGEEAMKLSKILVPAAIVLAVGGGAGAGIGIVIHNKHKHAARAAIAGMASGQPVVGGFPPAPGMAPQTPQVPGVPQPPVTPNPPQVVGPQPPAPSATRFEPPTGVGPQPPQQPPQV